MVRLLYAGFIAGARQLGAVVLVTLSVFDVLLLESVMQGTASTNSIENFCIAASPFLVWAYIIVAFGLGLTSATSVDVTAERMRCASQRIPLMTPRRVLITLAVQLAFSAMLVAILAIRAAPEILVMLTQNIGCAYAASILGCGNERGRGLFRHHRARRIEGR